jgi:hypothetical protein
MKEKPGTSIRIMVSVVDTSVSVEKATVGRLRRTRR